MENSWKKIPNLRTFERYYSKQDARKLIIFIKMLHEGFDAIVDARNRIGTFQGCTDIGLIYNTNLQNITSLSLSSSASDEVKKLSIDKVSSNFSLDSSINNLITTISLSKSFNRSLENRSSFDISINDNYISVNK